MILKEIIKILKATTITSSVDREINIKTASSADMMSAVLYYHTPDSLLITGLAQSQVIRTAEIAGIKTILFILNKKPAENLIALAEKHNISLLSTPYCMYTASGKLYKAGLPSCQDK